MAAQVVKNQPASAGDTGSIPGLGRFPKEGNGNPLQYPCLENCKDRGARQPTVHGVTKSQTQLSDSHSQYSYRDNPMERETWWAAVLGVAES